MLWRAVCSLAFYAAARAIVARPDRRPRFLAAGRSAIQLKGDIMDCGALPSYPNARPLNYEDARETRWDGNKTVKVEFAAGAEIAFECLPGFTTDASRDGNTTFQVLCSELGYFKPSGVCLEASKCGELPTIPNALPTGAEPVEGVDKTVEFSCAEGYSLDGQPVVAGGFKENQVFTLKCVEFSGEYEKFEGECKPNGFIPARETTKMYNQVFEALFVVSCKGTLKKEFGARNDPGVDDVCVKFEDSSLASQCGGLVTQIKADFEREQASRDAHDEAAGKEWYEEHDEGRPGIADEAQEFCFKLWKLLELQP